MQYSKAEKNKKQKKQLKKNLTTYHWDDLGHI